MKKSSSRLRKEKKMTNGEKLQEIFPNNCGPRENAYGRIYMGIISGNQEVDFYCDKDWWHSKYEEKEGK